MDNIVFYIIKANLTLSILFIVYWFFLRQETYFTFNRIFLILSVFFALILPSIEINLPDIFTDSSIQYIALEQFLSAQPNLVNNPVNFEDIYSNNHFLISNQDLIVTLLYVTGILITLFLSIRRFYYLWKIIFKNKYQNYQGMRIVKSHQNISLFSFFNYLVINKEDFSKRDFIQIVAHERIHHLQGHTIDLLLFEIMRIIFWINPVIYIMTNCLRTTHEYLADRGVLDQGYNKKAYQLLILKQVVKLPTLSITSPFVYSQTKRRISMLNRQKSSYFSNMKTLTIIPALLILFGLFNVPTGAIEVPLITDSNMQFDLPLREGRVTQGFGMGINPFTEKEVLHRGIDIASPRGTKIYASEDGIVTMVDSLKGHGNKIILQHGNGFSTHYSHLFKIIISKNENVEKGDIIGLVGSTGLSTAPHLHFEIRKDDIAIDPAEYLDFSTFGQK